ncbi:MAG TPA: thioredoxin-disulfide reductase [Myxococcales bacterium]|nr:thioredoxin-disulfide reductase [Myxococcales bacterium]
MAQHSKVLIIGSGPAGYTAAVYAARANLAPTLVAGSQPGGQLTITTEVENYPGFPKGVLGPELMELFKAQAERFGTKMIHGTITSVDFSKRPFRAVVDERDELTADAVIVSTGASAKWIGLAKEQELGGYGVSACATCDGFFFKGKELAVVGGGDTAMEEATFLTKFASKVTVIHRREELRASKIMQDKAKKNPKIAFIWNSVVSEIHGTRESGVTGLRLRNVISNETAEFAVQGLFVAIGHSPNTKLFKGVLDMDEKGYVKTAPGSTRTSVAGVFACGDVQDAIYRQAVTAAGSGCMAAIDAERWLEH